MYYGEVPRYHIRCTMTWRRLPNKDDSIVPKVDFPIKDHIYDSGQYGRLNEVKPPTLPNKDGFAETVECAMSSIRKRV